MNVEGRVGDYDESVGKKYRLTLLLAIALLCVIREAFFTATAKNPSKVNDCVLDPSIAPHLGRATG